MWILLSLARAVYIYCPQQNKPSEGSSHSFWLASAAGIHADPRSQEISWKMTGSTGRAFSLKEGLGCSEHVIANTMWVETHGCDSLMCFPMKDIWSGPYTQNTPSDFWMNTVSKISKTDHTITFLGCLFQTWIVLTISKCFWFSCPKEQSLNSKRPPKTTASSLSEEMERAKRWRKHWGGMIKWCHFLHECGTFLQPRQPCSHICPYPWKLTKAIWGAANCLAII